MKMIMRLPSVSTLKNYINENEQCSGWQDKIADQILANLTVNKIWGYGRVGFFSLDSFKIQKGNFSFHSTIKCLFFSKKKIIY
jgi:hypothetical protein